MTKARAPLSFGNAAMGCFEPSLRAPQRLRYRFAQRRFDSVGLLRSPTGARLFGFPTIEVGGYFSLVKDVAKHDHSFVIWPSEVLSSESGKLVRIKMDDLYSAAQRFELLGPKEGPVFEVLEQAWLDCALENLTKPLILLWCRDHNLSYMGSASRRQGVFLCVEPHWGRSRFDRFNAVESIAQLKGGRAV